jgi:hypothetical protein
VFLTCAGSFANCELVGLEDDVGVEAAIIAGSTVLGAVGQKKRGRAVRDAADEQANAELAEAKLQAQRIRKLARDVRSQATAAYAASGVDVSQGSPLMAEREITERSELDAAFTILGGIRRQRVLGKQGKAEMIGANYQAASTVLGGAADFYRASGWRTAG